MSLGRFIACWMSPEYPPERVSPGEMADAEGYFGFEFPSDYREAVLLCGLAAPTIALLDTIVTRECDLADISSMLRPAEIIETTEAWRAMGLPDDMVAFATDCCGNLFCFRSGAGSRVFYFDHDFKSVEGVAESFTGWIDAYCALYPH